MPEVATEALRGREARLRQPLSLMQPSPVGTAEDREVLRLTVLEGSSSTASSLVPPTCSESAIRDGSAQRHRGAPPHQPRVAAGPGGHVRSVGGRAHSVGGRDAADSRRVKPVQYNPHAAPWPPEFRRGGGSGGPRRPRPPHHRARAASTPQPLCASRSSLERPGAGGISRAWRRAQAATPTVAPRANVHAQAAATPAPSAGGRTSSTSTRDEAADPTPTPRPRSGRAATSTLRRPRARPAPSAGAAERLDKNQADAIPSASVPVASRRPSRRRAQRPSRSC